MPCRVDRAVGRPSGIRGGLCPADAPPVDDDTRQSIGTGRTRPSASVVQSARARRVGLRGTLRVGRSPVTGTAISEPRDEGDSSVDVVIEAYDRAWNASDPDERRRLLEAALTEDCEMIEPRGRFVGRAAIFERISGFSERFAGAKVEVTTQVDEHNGFARYGWRITNRDGTLLLDGIDVVERAADRRLHRVIMFFGGLDTT